MGRILKPRSVLAVRDLKAATEYYVEKLGFAPDGIEAEGWSFLSRDGFRVMLGECRNATLAGELGDHSYFVYLEVEAIDDLYDELTGRGADILHELSDKPWGMREFGVRTNEGHRIMFGQDIEASDRNEV